MFTDSVRERIPSMTPGQKKVAEYICDNLEKFSYQTISQISREAEVSETTVIRFSYTMDYSSFSEMQKALQKELLGSATGGEGEPPAAEDKNPYLALLETDIAILQNTAKRLDYRQLDWAAQLIAEAGRVFSIGFRTSSVAANWFANTAGALRPDVICVNSSSFPYNTLLDADEHSVAVAVSFPRYARETVLFSQHLKKQGGKLIVITDSPTSPVGQMADVLLLTKPNQTEARFNSMFSALSLLNLLVAGVAKKCPGYHSRINLQETLLSTVSSIIE